MNKSPKFQVAYWPIIQLVHGSCHAKQGWLHVPQLEMASLWLIDHAVKVNRKIGHANLALRITHDIHCCTKIWVVYLEMIDGQFLEWP